MANANLASWLGKGRTRTESETNQGLSMAQGENNQQAGRSSRIATIIQKLDIIMQLSEEVSDLLSKTVFELQKPMEYYGRLRESMLVGLESAGVALPPAADVEQEIAEFVPKNYRPPQPDQETP